MSMAKATDRELIALGVRHLLGIMIRTASEEIYNAARFGVLDIKERAICTGLHVVCGCDGPGATYIADRAALDLWASEHNEHGPEDESESWSPIKVEMT
jgi:hypothetical protein